MPDKCGYLRNVFSVLYEDRGKQQEARQGGTGTNILQSVLIMQRHVGITSYNKQKCWSTSDDFNLLVKMSGLLRMTTFPFSPALRQECASLHMHKHGHINIHIRWLFFFFCFFCFPAFGIHGNTQPYQGGGIVAVSSGPHPADQDCPSNSKVSFRGLDQPYPKDNGTFSQGRGQRERGQRITTLKANQQQQKKPSL